MAGAVEGFALDHFTLNAEIWLPTIHMKLLTPNLGVAVIIIKCSLCCAVSQRVHYPNKVYSCSTLAYRTEIIALAWRAVVHLVWHILLDVVFLILPFHGIGHRSS